MSTTVGGEWEIDAPWGHHKWNTWIGFIHQLVAQLEHFLVLGLHRGDDVDFTRRDIEGYKMILDKNDEELAAKFIKTKADYRQSGKPFRDNIEIAKIVLSGASNESC